MRVNTCNTIVNVDTTFTKATVKLLNALHCLWFNIGDDDDDADDDGDGDHNDDDDDDNDDDDDDDDAEDDDDDDDYEDDDVWNIFANCLQSFPLPLKLSLWQCDWSPHLCWCIQNTATNASKILQQMHPKYWRYCNQNTETNTTKILKIP